MSVSDKLTDDGGALNWAEAVAAARSPFKKWRAEMRGASSVGGRLEDAVDLLVGADWEELPEGPAWDPQSPRGVWPAWPSSLLGRVFPLPGLGRNRVHLWDSAPLHSAAAVVGEQGAGHGIMWVWVADEELLASHTGLCNITRHGLANVEEWFIRGSRDPIFRACYE